MVIRPIPYGIAAGVIVLVAMRSLTNAADAPTGDATIRAAAGGSEIVITTTSRLAGAIHSVTWNGKEFIDSTDHGRQLQSAANFDLRTPFVAEAFNQTEAGSRIDGAGPASTSRLLHLAARGNELRTTSRMAFWLRPGEETNGVPARNTRSLSNHRLTKRVTIGFRDLPHVIEYRVEFAVPAGESHTYAQFEAVTGYMPAEFSRFLKYNVKSRRFEPLSDGPGEQSWPVVLSTRSGSHAMGVFSPDQPSPGYRSAGYGRWRFRQARVTKWNCVFRLRNATDGIAAGSYPFRCFVLIGDLNTVRNDMEKLHRISVQAGDQGL